MGRLWVKLALIVMLVVPASSNDQVDVVGSLILPLDAPGLIILSGDITAATPLDFKRALLLRPNADTVVLASDGGSVYGALVIGMEIHERKLDTLVPENYGCYSACAFIFLAGEERKVDGELGVHQVSSQTELGATATQFTVADILDTLAMFQIDPGVASAMLRTPPEGMHVFSRDELASLSIERAAMQPPTSEPKSAPPGVIAPLPPAQIYDPTATTVVKKEPRPTGVGTFERDVTLDEATHLWAILEESGFSSAQAYLVVDALEEAIPMHYPLPRGSHLRLLFGPLSYNGETVVLYRITVYDPSHAHLGSAALTDQGIYVPSIEPAPRSLQPSGCTPTGKTARYCGL